ncbi:DUF2750 domain-containing protein [Polluticoccus soli]|uniref:DUF2750 domain-containing protein n=1 Tax=Polluticoccus soli TaxID=3034150 RepID=UPI0023E10C7F|nr:DUF2750 domain-containing protein [Flavipsychrobacter sp. JY13-12]
MSNNPSEKEVESVIAMSAFDRYQYLVKQAAESEELYSLKKGDEWALADVEDNVLFSLWPAAVYATREATSGWAGYEAKAISLEEFENTLLPLITKAGCMFNVFSVDGKLGFIVDREEFLRDLGEELEKYE